MSELDYDQCIELLMELIRRDGGIVFRNDWDSGGPGAGADSETVHCYEGRFWPHDSTLGFSGPYDSLEEALAAGPGFITSATTQITCDVVSQKKLVSMLSVQSAPRSEIEINGELWEVSSEGKLVRYREK